MKKALITTILSATLLLTGCAGDEESSAEPDSNQPLVSTAEGSAPESSVTNEANGEAPVGEKIAPITIIPSALSEETADYQTSDPIAAPLFELNGIAYETDVLNLGYGFMLDESGKIMILTYNYGEEPIELSEYIDSVESGQVLTNREVLYALRELDTLEYIGQADYIEDTANAFYYYNSYLFYYNDKILLIEPPSAPEADEIYLAAMFKPCE